MYFLNFMHNFFHLKNLNISRATPIFIHSFRNVNYKLFQKAQIALNILFYILYILAFKINL